MKKLIAVGGVVLITVIIAITILYFYLLFKVFTVFGFWTICWTTIVATCSGFVLGHLFGSRSESNGSIMYNPKELPKVLHIVISLLIGYFLYTKIDVPNIDHYNYLFGMFYLILLALLPLGWALYKLIRDRNDFVKIDGSLLSYRDNSEQGQINLNKVRKITLLGNLVFEFTDKTEQTIKVSEMNFNAADLISLVVDIESRISKDTSANDESESAVDESKKNPFEVNSNEL